MALRIDHGSRMPPYEQLRQQIIDHVGRGELVPGDRLQPVRRLAEELGIAPNTVARAYRELEVEGYVETAGRHGTRIAASRVHAGREAERLTRDYVASLRNLGLDAAAAGRLLQAEWGEEIGG